MLGPPRPVRDVLGTGALAGWLAGLAAGALDAVWSWGPAAQFVPELAARLRFVAYGALTLGAAGLVAGALGAAGSLVLARGSRLGELGRFAWRAHAERRARDPREALVGLSLTLTALPLSGLALYAVHAWLTPVVVRSHAMGLAVLAVIAATLAALGLAAVISFPLARALELALAPLAARWRPMSSPLAPLVAALALGTLGAAAWTQQTWATVRLLPLHGPLVIASASALAIGTYRPARRVVDRWRAWRPGIRRPAWLALALGSAVLALAAGDSPAVIKASTAFTGLGAPIARAARRAFDLDHDGYAWLLGGGDCDDGDRTVHPGALEIPDDGIDQNCLGGDASASPASRDVGFVPVPAGVPGDASILLVTIDTVRADHLGSYGYPRATTPNLDKLGAEGTVFEAAWAHAPSTRYSIPAILTGRLPLDVPYDHSVDGWPGLSPEATTLAEALAPLGFVTGAITNYWYFDRARRMDQGVSEFDNENARLHGAVAGAGPERTRGSSSREQTDKAIAFVERHAGQRWFLWVHYYDPHFQYEPHPEVPSFGTDEVARYDGELRFTDHHIGRLLDTLRARGLLDRTIVAVTGDHGEGFGEHQITLHGYHLYAAQTKVPLILRVPGQAARRVAMPAGHVDLLPTLVNLAGGQPTAEMMGRSLVDVLAGAPAPARTVFQQLSYEGGHEVRAGADAQCHVIYNVSPDTSWEVYRVDRDPLERHDLSADESACAGARRAVERWYDAEQVPAGAAEALVTGPVTSRLDAELGASVQLLDVEGPPRARPGEPITLTWTFEARGVVDASWRVFAHVKGPGSMFVNGDHRPVRPFEWWKRGQRIRYTTRVTLPRHAPPGTYTVWAGLFQGSRRATVRAVKPGVRVEGDAVAAATFEVVP